MRPSWILSRFRIICLDKGLYGGICHLFSLLRPFCQALLLRCRYYKTFKTVGTFTLEGRSYQYLYRWYNWTWANERAVELPIVLSAIQQYRGRSILEVGNVLSHYVSFNHDILDKYEIAPGVINQDVVDLHPGKQYDLIVSISTLEHVGWDEIPREPTKVLRAIEHLRQLLAPAGKLLITFPVGYNPELDRLVRERSLPFSKEYYLKRVSEDNRWEQVPCESVERATYDYRAPCAHAVVVGVVEV